MAMPCINPHTVLSGKRTKQTCVKGNASLIFGCWAPWRRKIDFSRFEGLFASRNVLLISLTTNKVDLNQDVLRQVAKLLGVHRGGKILVSFDHNKPGLPDWTYSNQSCYRSSQYSDGHCKVWKSPFKGFDSLTLILLPIVYWGEAGIWGENILYRSGNTLVNGDLFTGCRLCEKKKIGCNS